VNETSFRRQITLRAEPLPISVVKPGTDQKLRGELMTGRRVLLADDLTPVLSAVARLLEDSFEVVAMVTDGPSALESVMALKPDLVILDISMPGMSGIDVARELRKRECKAKIVFLTIHQDSDILATCLAAGGLGYVVKVLMDTDLIPAMNEALADRVFVSRFSYPQDFPNNKW
jgi:DNA-binding NarL/FixJ family response regulator